MTIHPISNYPHPPLSSLHLQYLDQPLATLPTPTLVLDRAIVRRNSAAMLAVCAALGVGFRAHVKSHKTLELARMQVGESGPAHFVTSTLIEAESLLPFVLECVGRGRACSILYGVPIPQSSIPRLLHLASKLPAYSLSILVDNLAAYSAFQSSLPASSPKIGVYIKIDTGYHRAGISTSSPKFPFLIEAVVEKSGESFKGFYSHFGHSYAGSSEEDAASGLIEELKVLDIATEAVPSSFRGELVLTVGATPTSTAAQNMLSSNSPRVGEFKAVLERIQKKHKNIGLRLLVEVTSVYDEREKPEALISAGSLALGREPCKSYPGWGVVTGDLGNKDQIVYDDRGAKTGWIVGRISQEHGILTWEGPRDQFKPLAIGDKLMVWPNHACVAGVSMGWYLIVDSDQGGDKIVDVWVRWRGW
ncbi:hypothetical protein K505DRAFT_261812 [Melanomma pulvis-pyrius CBS 109.77]|uniref:D-serine dehydratase n=1 Tax=Melanomma pulvis-pyrius CBS 109.77 TaxID=1314802 RepID=A0A6A6WNP5_9PLEO|nr:hypothetical protein K505DRAFT_261812 [Melanomma pulvis-pyrius CBS 109.77]